MVQYPCTNDKNFAGNVLSLSNADCRTRNAELRFVSRRFFCSLCRFPMQIVKHRMWVRIFIPSPLLFSHFLGGCNTKISRQNPESFPTIPHSAFPLPHFPRWGLHYETQMLEPGISHSYSAFPLLPSAFLAVGLSGLEPLTPALSAQCSNRLSYRPPLLNAEFRM